MMMQNMAQQYANNYVETSVSEATPHKLVDMLYEGLFKNLTLVKVFIEQKNFEKKAEHMSKALAIVNSLRAGVDFDKGGDIAQNLFAIYDYAYRQLFRASANNDVTLIDEVNDLIKPLREAWSELPDTYKRANHDQIKRMN